MQIVAYEGGNDVTDGLNYGAAAVRYQGHIYNGYTWNRCSEEDYQQYVEEDTLGELSSPVELADSYFNNGVNITVWLLDKNLPKFEPLFVPLREHLQKHAVAADIGENRDYYVITDVDRITEFAHEYATRLVEQAEEAQEDTKSPRWNIALALNSNLTNRWLNKHWGKG